MSAPPELLRFLGDWPAYEDAVYATFMETFVNARIRFRGQPVKAQFRPDSHGKGFSFWHVISEAPNRGNRNEVDRIPDIHRCERIRWIAWSIHQAAVGDAEVSWWENNRGCDTRVVIWAERDDYVVVLAKRRGYWLLKTAYTDVKPHRRRSFEAERAAFRAAQKG